MRILSICSALFATTLGVALPEPQPEPNPTAAPNPELLFAVPTLPSGLPSKDLYVFFDLDDLSTQTPNPTAPAAIRAGVYYKDNESQKAIATSTA